MSKTPYEIRLELLKLAQDQTRDEYYREWEKAVVKMEGVQDTDKKLSILNEVPSYPTSQEILIEAEKFKTFVDKG